MTYKNTEQIRRIKINKVDIDKWEQVYNDRFLKYLNDKDEHIQRLDQKWNKPNQAVPVVNNYRSVSRPSRGAVIKVNRDLTPTFKPRINRNSKRILEKSARKKRSRNMKYDSLYQTNSVDNLSKMFYSTTDNTSNLPELLKEFNSAMHYASKKTDDYRTKGQTEATFTSHNYGTAPQNTEDNFKHMLDSYEQNLSNAILVEEQKKQGTIEPSHQLSSEFIPFQNKLVESHNIYSK